MSPMEQLFKDVHSHCEHLHGHVLQLNETERALQACRVTGPQQKDHG